MKNPYTVGFTPQAYWLGGITQWQSL